MWSSKGIVALILNHFDPYEQPKLEIISARAAKNRVLTDQREKGVADAVEWQHVFSRATKKTESYVPPGKFFDDGL